MKQKELDVRTIDWSDVEHLANTYFGDANLDGDQDFSSSDFVKAFTGGGYEQGPRAATAAVPEPHAFSIALWAALAAFGSLRHSRA